MGRTNSVTYPLGAQTACPLHSGVQPESSSRSICTCNGAVGDGNVSVYQPSKKRDIDDNHTYTSQPTNVPTSPSVAEVLKGYNLSDLTPKAYRCFLSEFRKYYSRASQPSNGKSISGQAADVWANLPVKNQLVYYRRVIETNGGV
ncbi:hypothetical protein NLI96_g5302 [Meripilus lineatus]|uniref:Uncharacterized protein n=1 Tax=Meripilus lineatus TaxID=2056292 RepID=A0AAD5V546_9APHY|nr:hypothetical protein NLI96_g5302 [Physisporinus lineatus]